MNEEKMLEIYFYVFIACAVTGGVGGALIKVIFTEISKKETTTTAIRSAVIGIVVTFFSGGIYFISSFRSGMLEIAANMHSYQLSFALSRDYGTKHLDSIMNSIATDAIIGVLIGGAVTVMAVIVACFVTIKQDKNKL